MDNITLTIKFSNTYRYIDDLLCINNKDFELSISDIYPKELILKKTNTSHRKSPSLDLDITITSNQFITKVYDKREDFNLITLITYVIGPTCNCVYSYAESVLPIRARLLIHKI